MRLVAVRASFSTSLFATNVVLKIPCPRNMATSKVKETAGKCKYHPEHGLLVWKCVVSPAPPLSCWALMFLLCLPARQDQEVPGRRIVPAEG